MDNFWTVQQGEGIKFTNESEEAHKVKKIKKKLLCLAGNPIIDHGNALQCSND